MRSNISVGYISTSILLVVLIFSFSTIAIGEQLDIKITDLDDQDISQINEGVSFKISVLDLESEESTPFLAEVDIEFNREFFQIDETLELILQAPEVSEDTSMIITASKEGYNSTNKSIIIINNLSQDEIFELTIVPETFTVEAGNTFSVLVKDLDGNVVSGATVGIQSYGETRTTDDDGRAWLKAPEDEESITIIAQKDGYSGDIEIKVNIPEHWWIKFIKSPYFFIVIALIFLIIVIIYVNIRQKKVVYTRAKEISNKKIMKRYENDKENAPLTDKSKDVEGSSTIKDNVRTKPDEDPKVEEIRISRPRKEKEIVDVEPEEDETEKVIKKKQLQKRDYDWFEGTEDIRYEIDKLTGEVDEEGLDKWYEGVDGLKEKIDKKVKKKDKKKNEEK